MGFVFILDILLFLDIFDPLLGSLNSIFGVKTNSFNFSTNYIIDEFLELPQLFLYLVVFPFSLLGFLVETCYLHVDFFESYPEIIDGLKLIFQLIEVL